MRLMYRSGFFARSSPIRWMAAAKSLSNSLPLMTSLTLPVPSNLNWFTPYFSIMLRQAIAEVAIVFRAGEREPALVGFESLRLCGSHALLFRAVVAAPGREPDAGCSAELRRGLRHFCESVWKTWIEFPESRGIVPAIVEEETVEFNAALFGQVLAETLHDFDCLLLVVTVEESQVVPRVVVQKGAIGMRAFEFDIVQEVATQLCSVSHADHGGISHALRGL